VVLRLRFLLVVLIKDVLRHRVVLVTMVKDSIITTELHYLFVCAPASSQSTFCEDGEGVLILYCISEY
jgi:hypothetical protein